MNFFKSKKSNKAKRLMSFVLCIATVLGIGVLSSAANVGDVIGYALTTDIAATINGYDIPSFNVDGYTYVVAEDLNYYGFSVIYDNTQRALYINRDESQSWVSKSYVKPSVSANQIGQKAHKLLYTDIATYVSGSYSHGYNIDGQTIIKFDSLSAFGTISYDNNKREISLKLYGLNTNPNPTNRGKQSSTTQTTTTSYYPGTTVRTYTSVTGRNVKDYINSVYVYDFNEDELLTYMAKLYIDGWTEYKNQTKDSKLTYYLKKDSKLISVTYNAKYSEVWIIPSTK